MTIVNSSKSESALKNSETSIEENEIDLSSQGHKSPIDLYSFNKVPLVTARPVQTLGQNSENSIPFNRPVLFGPELGYIAEAVYSGQISGSGKFSESCEEFLKSMLGSKNEVLMTPSCTSALEMAAMMLDLGPGDEVILPSFTFVTTGTAFMRTGATPVFADVSSDFPNIDPSHIEALITPKTKAVVVVHYAGVPCDMDRINAFCAQRGIAVVEDAAHALGGFYKGRPLGTQSSLATFSFHETKNVTCGEGGALVVNNPALVEKAHIIRDKGTNRRAFSRGDAPFYTLVGPGSSYVISEVLSAFLLAQLQNIDRIQKHRHSSIRAYQQGLEHLKIAGKLNFQESLSAEGSAGHMFYLTLDTQERREALRAYLKEKGILAVSHYQPMHESPYVIEKWGKQSALPNTEWIARHLLRLPLFNSITVPQIERVCLAVSDFFSK